MTGGNMLVGHDDDDDDDDGDDEDEEILSPEGAQAWLSGGW